MCGRYVTRSDKQRIAAALKVSKVPSTLLLAPDWNVAPSTFQPVVRLVRDGDITHGTAEREIVSMLWGLVPATAKDPASVKRYSTTNARAESILTSNFFRQPFLSKRCVAPMDFFYEWLRRTVPRFGKNGRPLKDAEVKTPYAFGPRDGGMFGVACVYDTWKNQATGEWLLSFAVITCEANELMATIHNRMPVILHQRDYGRYLDCSDPDRPPMDLLRPYDAELMTMAPANPAVGNVRNNGPAMLQPPPDPPALYPPRADEEINSR